MLRVLNFVLEAFHAERFILAEDSKQSPGNKEDFE